MKNVILVDCPVCGASAGTQCGPIGNHPGRVEAALRAGVETSEVAKSSLAEFERLKTATATLLSGVDVTLDEIGTLENEVLDLAEKLFLGEETDRVALGEMAEKLKGLLVRRREMILSLIRGYDDEEVT